MILLLPRESTGITWWFLAGGWTGLEDARWLFSLAWCIDGNKRESGDTMFLHGKRLPRWLRAQETGGNGHSFQRSGP